jgi:hypothetical protein
MDTVDPPVFVRVTGNVWLFPSSVFPKFKPATLGERYPEDVATPDNCTVVVLVFSRPLLRDIDPVAMAKAPLAAPAIWGANLIIRSALWRDARLKGRAGPTKLKPLPLMVAPVTVSVVLPLLLTVTAKVLLLPTCTLPKLRVEELTDIWLTEGRDVKSNPESSKLEARKFHRETRNLISGSLSPCENRTVGGDRETLTCAAYSDRNYCNQE